MRAKTQQSYKRTLHTYQLVFGIKQPYQVLVDGDFCQEALVQKLYVKDELSNVLLGLTKPLVTECTLEELKSKGRNSTNALIVAQRFDRARCPHKTPVASEACISQLIGASNSHHYCVASQSKKLRTQLRSVPGVPLLHIKKRLVVLEPMSPESKEALQKKELAKTLPSRSEAHLLHANKVSESLQGPVEKKKTRKIKGANPLSMKKKAGAKGAKPTVKESQSKETAALSEKKKRKEPTQEEVSVLSATETGDKKRRRRKKKSTPQTEASEEKSVCSVHNAS
ncbi:PIN domain-like protein [Spinellus fusiger]|nr:PIN domain-like protein [Spinellus fusiger]